MPRITIKNLQRRIRLEPAKIKKLILKTLGPGGRLREGEITVCVLDDRRMRNLNRSFLKHDQTTDVLAFGRLKGAEALCADIAVSADTALRNCRVYGTTPQEELYLYIIHGVLHLLGYDDKTAGQRALMQKKAEEILKEP